MENHNLVDCKESELSDPDTEDDSEEFFYIGQPIQEKNYQTFYNKENWRVNKINSKNGTSNKGKGKCFGPLSNMIFVFMRAFWINRL